MIAISLKFPAGRYHMTPWGRHVNEGAVEWPPSPWRILRALIAVWKRTLPELPESEVKPIFERLAAELPRFVLPPASTGHTRHYMPGADKKKDLVFDTFVAVPKDARLLVYWRDSSLSEAQRQTLARILSNLNVFGRSESWCEAELLDDSAASQCISGARKRSEPLEGSEDQLKDGELIRLLCPDPKTAFLDDHVVKIEKRTIGRGKAKQTIEERRPLYDPAWNICIETLKLHEEKWSDPPGSRWVQYVRPRDCFKIEPNSSRALKKEGPVFHVVRYALDSTVLPLVTETLPVAEAAHGGAIKIYKFMFGRDGTNGSSSTLSGKDEEDNPLRTGHNHAYYLPTDEDGDGRLDHLTIFARIGFKEKELRALSRLSELKTGRKGEESHPLRVLLLGMGSRKEYQQGPLKPSKVWVSATPYIATRYAKTRGRNRIDLSSPQARADFLIADLRAQLRDRLAKEGVEVSSEVSPIFEPDGVFVIKPSGSSRVFRPIQFKRFRRKSGDDGGYRLAGSFRLKFSEAVSGPIVLGHSSHFGMGLFMPE